MLPQVFLVMVLVVRCFGYQRWDDGYHRHRIPQDIMVDVVNDLALKLLAIHNEGNNNNIAISPTGALSVLVALKEGVRGSAKEEIHRAVGIPTDLSIIRIGLRDIHRHLKSYFIPDEGFLSGLTLSHDNVTLNPDYEEILRFYGFDINEFNNALFPEVTTEKETTTTEVTTEPTSQKESTEISTTHENIEQTTTAYTTSGTTTNQPTETVSEAKTERETTLMPTETTTLKATETTTTESPMSTSKDLEETTWMEATTVEENPLTKETTVPSTTIPKDVEILSTTVKVETTTEMNDTPTTETTNTELTTEAMKNADESKNTTRRNTRSVVDYIIARYYDEHIVTQRPPPYNSENELYFLIDGKYKETNINYMTYDTVLPFHYISHLKTSALRFPLDSSRYFLLLLLPDEPNQIDQLVCELRLNTKLEHILNSLKYTHVKAVIPSFMLKGYIVLTPTFQKMGMRRVFEPRQADFSPMTAERGIYVTNIEQAVTVNIRNYIDPDTMNNNQHLQRHNPVLFKADHPFLYFVIDSEINVTLMTGKIINPLNSRIR